MLDDLSRLSAREPENSESNEEQVDENDEDEDREKEDEEQEELIEDEDVLRNEQLTDSRKSSTPIRQHVKVVNAEELFDRIIQHVDKVITSKLKTLKIGTSAGENQEAGKSRRDKSKSVGIAETKTVKGLKVKSKVQPEKKRERKEQVFRLKKPSKSDSESSARASESECESIEGASSENAEESEPEGKLKRRPRPVCDWKLKYDGKDEGRNLNKFVSEVEFMAEAENISKRSLFNEAIHLFSGDARAWYIEGRRNKDFRSWTELVTELKLEYQPPDMDFHYEQQAASRRQKRGEKFQDYYHANKEIFDQMAVPPTEQRKFDIVFRNLRSDYKNSLLVKGVRTLRTLKVWGRKLDSANWFLYRKPDGEQGSRASQVHEINSRPFQREYKSSSMDWRDRKTSGRPEWNRQKSDGFKGSSNENRDTRKPTVDNWKADQSKPKQNPPSQQPQEGNSKSILEKRVAAYRVPERTVCYNCRGQFHHYKTCLKEKEVFCTICGFHDFSTDKCPFCTKNGKRSM